MDQPDQPVEIALRDDSGAAGQYRGKCDERGDWRLQELNCLGWSTVAEAQKGDPVVILKSDAFPITVLLEFLQLVRAPIYGVEASPGDDQQAARPPRPAPRLGELQGWHCEECGFEFATVKSQTAGRCFNTLCGGRQAPVPATAHMPWLATQEELDRCTCPECGSLKDLTGSGHDMHRPDCSRIPPWR